MITTDFSNPNFVQIAWNGQVLRDGIRITAENGARGQISIHGKTPNAVSSTGANMTQSLVDAKQKAESILKKSVVEGTPSQDIQPILEAAGWEVFPR